MRSGFWVCIKEVLARASGFDMPVYAQFTKGSVAWFDEEPDQNHWRAIHLSTASDSVLSLCELTEEEFEAKKKEPLTGLS